MIVLVQALTPTTLSSDRFLAHREGGDLRTWAEAHPTACLRRFSIRNLGDCAPAVVSDTRVEETSDTFEVVIAYAPNGRHGPNFLTEVDKAIESDQTQVHKTIGPPGYASLTATATVMHQDGFSREDGNGVTFSVIRYAVAWYRSLS